MRHFRRLCGLDPRSAADGQRSGVCPKRGAGRGPRGRHGRRVHGRRRRRVGRVTGIRPASRRAPSSVSWLDTNQLDRRSGWLVALGTPPLGLSYYRTAIAEEKNGRNTLVAHHAGVSLVQSLGGRLAVGTTLKLVHGIASPAEGVSTSTNKFDADVGVMATGSLGQLGLSVRNLLAAGVRVGGRGDSPRSARPGGCVDSRDAGRDGRRRPGSDDRHDAPGGLAGRGDRSGGPPGERRRGFAAGCTGTRRAARRPGRGADRQHRRRVTPSTARPRRMPRSVSGRPTGIGAGASGCGSCSSRLSTLTNFI